MHNLIYWYTFSDVAHPHVAPRCGPPYVAESDHQIPPHRATLTERLKADHNRELNEQLSLFTLDHEAGEILTLRRLEANLRVHAPQ